jgi:hypothetical protein
MHRDIESLIDARYLELCTPQMAYEWLKELQRPEPTGTSRTDFFAKFLGPKDWSRNHEMALYGRDDRMIDYGLARYGLSAPVANELYKRLPHKDRLVMRACHPAGGGPLEPLKLETDEAIQEMAIIVGNPYLEDEVLKQFFERTGAFKRLDDEHFLAALKIAATNPWLHDDTDERKKHSRSESYWEMLKVAWSLPGIVPVERKWSDALWELYRNMEPVGVDFATMINRWYIDEEGKDPERQSSWNLRRLLGRYIQGGGDHADLAVRVGFYSAFYNKDFTERQRQIEAYVTRDGVPAAYALIENRGLWMWFDLREKLKEVVLQVARENSDQRLWATFERKEKEHKERNPDWWKH